MNPDPIQRPTSSPVLPTRSCVDPSVTGARVAVLPIGSFEQHGPHMPLTTDTLVAVAIANAIASEVAIWLLPPTTVGCSHEHAGFPGTISISAMTLAAIVNDIAVSLHTQGIDHLVLINGHGGNYVLSNVVQEANTMTPRSMALFPSRAHWDEARIASGMETQAHDDMHAGELEGSILLTAWPDHLDHEWPQAWASDDHLAPDRRDLLTEGLRAYTPTGIVGRPSLATKDKGRLALTQLGKDGAQVVKSLLSQPTDT